MHLLVISSWFPNCVNRVYGVFFLEQALAIKARGYSLGVLVPNHSRGRKLDYLKRVVGLGLNYYRDDDSGLPVWSENNFLRASYHSTTYKSWVAKNRMRVFRDYVKEYGMPDVIHAHSIFDGGVWASEIKAEFGIPYVITEHYSGFLDATKIVRRDEAVSVINTADRCFAVGASLAHGLMDMALDMKVEVLGNIVDTKFFDLKPSANKQKTFKYCIIASLTKNKAIDIVIRALASGMKGLPVELHVGGAGEEEKSLKLLCENYGVSNQIFFLGSLDRSGVKRLIQNSDALISSSYRETFGITIIEALACGKPVIATRSGGPEDILREDFGKLIPVGDDKAMENAMLEMMENCHSYNAEQIRSHALANYSEEVIVSRLLKVYEEVVG